MPMILLQNDRTEWMKIMQLTLKSETIVLVFSVPPKMGMISGYELIIMEGTIG